MRDTTAQEEACLAEPTAQQLALQPPPNAPRIFRRTLVIACSLLVLTVAACGYSGRDERRTETYIEPGWPKPNNPFQQAQLPVIQVSLTTIEGAEYVNDDELCLTCHKVYTETFQNNVHRGIHEGQSCEACHGPASRHLETRGREPGLLWSFKTMAPAQASEVCLKCHEQNTCSPGAQWRTSVHAHKGLTCTNCHTAHYNVPPGSAPVNEPDFAAVEQARAVRLVSFQENGQEDRLPSLRGTSHNLNAVSPNVCYRCHGDMHEMQTIAGPHQICGPNGFNCTTCHDAHGKLLEYSRQELCMQCHKAGSPTMAWHSSTHSLFGVACTDCHNPHPRQSVERFPNISYTNITRPVRRVMGVQEPEACYKCHPDIFGQTNLPYHHPIREGKMVCSDCHDAHGQMEGGLNAETVNLLCWRCHADKQGPFTYEHPPVVENCSICHEPHGTVAPDLLHQSPTFLCLRCHNGHRTALHGHPGAHVPPNAPPQPGLRADIDRNPALRQALYSDCMSCHTQVHGSDLPSSHLPGAMFR